MRISPSQPLVVCAETASPRPGALTVTIAIASQPGQSRDTSWAFTSKAWQAPGIVLWGFICLVFGFGNDVESDEGVLTIRTQFEKLLGRALTPPEWGALVAHAKNHHETVIKPSMAKSHTDKP